MAGTVKQLDRLERIYPSRSDLLKKLESIDFSYSYPVVGRYKNDQGTTCIILAVGNGVGSGYDILGDSGLLGTGESGQVYTFTRTSYNLSDQEAILAALFGESPVSGDICIISTSIDGNLRSRNSFIYTSEGRWEAMGVDRVDAENVILRSDINLSGTYDSFGNIQKSDKTWKTAGKSVWEVLNEALDQTVEPGIGQEPAVSLIASVSGQKEVGSVISQGYTLKLTDGYYLCAGVKESIEAQIQEATVSLGSLKKTDIPSGSFGQITLGPGYSEYISAQVTIGTEKYAKNNKGALTDLIWGPSKIQIKSSTLSSFRNGIWYGTRTSSITDWTSTNELGQELRKLGKSGKSYTSATLSLSVRAGTTQIIIAWLSGNTGLSRVFDETNNEDISLSNFTSHTVKIPGASGTIDSDYAGTYEVLEYSPTSGSWLKDITLQLKFT